MTIAQTRRHIVYWASMHDGTSVVRIRPGKAERAAIKEKARMRGVVKTAHRGAHEFNEFVNSDGFATVKWSCVGGRGEKIVKKIDSLYHPNRHWGGMKPSERPKAYVQKHAGVKRSM